MKIEQQAPASEYNPEVQVKMTLSELKTIIALLGNSKDTDLETAIKRHLIFIGKDTDTVKYVKTLTPIYDSMKEQYNEIPKKPKFQPITFTIESEEELAAIRIGTGQLSGNVIEKVLTDLEVKCNSNEVDKIYNANYSMFRQFDKIFEGRE